MKKNNSKSRKATAIAVISICLCIAIAIPLNVLASKFDMSWDMTPSKLYSLTDTTTDYLDSLDDSGKKVDMYFLMKMETLEKDSSLTALYYALKQYSEYNCINFEDIDPDLEPEKVDKLKTNDDMTLSSGDIIIKYDDITKRLPASTMYQKEVTTDSDGNSQPGEMYFEGENLITGAIKAAVTGFTPTVYFLTGHGEDSLEDDFTRLSANLTNYNYAAKELNLSKEDKVPSDASIIIEAGPTKDISDSELDKLDEYLDGGGNMTLLMTPNKSDTVYTNLEKIMDEFCIAMDYDRVRETDNDMHVSGDAYTIQCNLTEVDSSSTENSSSNYDEDFMSLDQDSSNNGTVDLTSSLINNGLTTFMPESRSFYEKYNDNMSKMTMNTFITTNSTAVGDPYGGKTSENDDEIKSSEGLYLSLYSQDNSRNDAKLVVFGSSDFLTDDNVSSDYFINPLYLFLSTVSWMQSSDVDMGIAAKSSSYDTMSFKNASDARNTMVVLVIYPIIIAVIGIVIWAIRRKA